MYALVFGVENGSRENATVVTLTKVLTAVALDAGFSEPTNSAEILPDPGFATPNYLRSWKLFSLMPEIGEPNFLLSITAPESPTISAIPCQRPVSTSEFLVMCLPDFFVVSSILSRDVVEFTKAEDVSAYFTRFLSKLQ